MPASARLEIHEINVGQGDAVLIVNRDLEAVARAIASQTGHDPAQALEPIDFVPYAVAAGIGLEGTVRRALLIDGGDDEYGGDLLAYLDRHGVLETDPGTRCCPRLDVLVSHYHDDHLAGLRSIFKERVERPARRGRRAVAQAALVERYRPARVFQTTLNPVADPATARFQAFEQDVFGAHSAGAYATERKFIDPGGIEQGTTNPTVIDLGTGVGGIPIQLFCLAAAQTVWNEAEGRMIAVPSVGRTPDQNDRSVVLVLQYGSFRYFVGGDIAGSGGAAGGNEGGNAVDPAVRRYYSAHADVESTLGPALEAAFPATTAWAPGAPKYPSAGYCTAMKANHHGSASSVDVHLLGTLRPMVMLVSCGVKSRFHRHPTQQVINRATPGYTAEWTLRDGSTAANTVQRVYVTEVAERVRGEPFEVELRGACIMGDIVLRPVDETVQAVQDAAEPGTRLSVQVYGTGEQTGIAASAEVTSLRPTEPVNAADAWYPIGPWYHSDVH